jgi:hypothetical protein
MRRISFLFLFLFLLCGFSFGQLNTTGASVGLCPSPTACGPTDASFAITPSNSGMAVGQMQQYLAELVMSDGSDGGPYTYQCSGGWQSSATNVATITQGGVVTAVAAGTTSISCTLPSNTLLAGSTNLTVQGPPIFTNPTTCAFPPCALTAGVQGSSYSFLLAASGGVPPYTFSISTGSLPSGLSLSSTSCGANTNCNIQGTPSSAGTTFFTVESTDSAGTPNVTTLAVFLTVSAAGTCGTLPAYCARTDTSVVSGVLANGGNPPAAMLGLNGAGNNALDDLNSGPAQVYIHRVTDYAMVQANLPVPSTNFFSVTSSSTQRAFNCGSLCAQTTEIFSTDDNSGSTGFFSHTVGSNPPVTAIVGVAGKDANNIHISGAEFSTTNPLLFYGGGQNTSQSLSRATINQYLQDGTPGAGSWAPAHIVASVNLDPINCPGLTSYNSGPLGTTWNKYVATQLADDSAGSGTTPAQAMDYRYVQDQSSLIITYTPGTAGHGCRWLDLRSGQYGGDWGGSGFTTGFGPLPAPAAAQVNQARASSSSLISGHQYNVQVTYAMTGLNGAYGGESTPSASTLVGLTPTGGNALQVVPPTANPGGGTGINLTMTATNFNVYVCDNTANPGCTPTLQTNGTNPSGAIPQPSISTVACNSGSTTYTFYLVAKNSGGTSVPSAAVTATGPANNPLGCVVKWTGVTNATKYDVLLDSVNTVGGTVTTACSACSATVNGNVGTGTSQYVVASNPITTAPVITSLSTTGPTPPTVNTAGPMFHNLRMDPSGNWVFISVANAWSILQPGPAQAPMGYLWYVPGGALIPGQVKQATGANASVYAGYMLQHWTTKNGVQFDSLQVPNNAALAETTYNTSPATMNSTTQFLNLANQALDTESGDQHLSGNYLLGPIFEDAYPLANVYVLPYVPYNGEITAFPLSGGSRYRFCHTWDSGQQSSGSGSNFYGTPRGNVSQDGAVMIFTSDMQRNANGSQGTAAVGLGSESGGSTCTVGPSGTCRFDVYMCQLK